MIICGKSVEHLAYECEMKKSVLYNNGTQIVQKFTSLILDEIESDRVVNVTDVVTFISSDEIPSGTFDETLYNPLLNGH